MHQVIAFLGIFPLLLSLFEQTSIKKQSLKTLLALTLNLQIEILFFIIKNNQTEPPLHQNNKNKLLQQLGRSTPRPESRTR